jgi:hypothetical protein
VTVGEALAEARYQAGLTVDQVAERTRIREAVIRCIEQDDYDACGGDLYVRGYVRAIAGAVGIDAQPLIREYDAGRAKAAGPGVAPAPPTVPVAQTAQTAPVAPVAPAAPTVPVEPVPTAVHPVAPLLPPPTRSLADETAFDLPVITDDTELTSADLGFTFDDPGFAAADPGFTVADPGFSFSDPGFDFSEPGFDGAYQGASGTVDAQYITPELVPDSLTPAYTQQREPSAWSKRIRGRRWLAGIAVLVVAALVVAGVAGSHIVSSLRHSSAAGSAAAKQTPTGGTDTGAKSSPSASPTPTPTQTPTVTPPPVQATSAIRALPVALAAAFGPGGTATGDNPQTAMYVITPGSLYPWASDWYTTANFGMLKPGTGLLLDMGKKVTITSVRIDLSGYQGANLQLRVGNAAVLGDMRVAARASGVGGTIRLRLASAVRARYLLIWFTQLPPDGAGHFQENVYRVVVNGRP